MILSHHGGVVGVDLAIGVAMTRRIPEAGAEAQTRIGEGDIEAAIGRGMFVHDLAGARAVADIELDGAAS